MNEEQAKMLADMYAFWHEPPTLDQPSRAVQLDKVLALTRGATFSGKALMMLFGFILTFGAVVGAIRAFVEAP